MSSSNEIHFVELSGVFIYVLKPFFTPINMQLKTTLVALVHEKGYRISKDI